MSTRKLLIGLVSAVVFAAGFGSAILPAGASLRTFVATLSDGRVITVSADVPAGTSLASIRSLPGVDGTIISLSETAPAPATGPATTTTTPSTTTTTTPTTTTTTPSGGPQAAGDKPQHSTSVKPSRRGPNTTRVIRPSSARTGAGAPTAADPSLSLALPGPAPVGVPNFFIDKFRIPPFLLPIYQAAGIQYGVRWEVLAAINEIETDYGRNLSVSTAGAEGWMQFMPATWKTYGVDANRDGAKDPYNPVDAIFAAARYLKAAGAAKSIRQAIFAYNHADWYVDSVLLRARLISGLPADLVGSLTGLTEGHFPVHAKARYADDLSAAEARRRAKAAGTAAVADQSDPDRRTIDIFAKAGSPAIAVQDGKIESITTEADGSHTIRLTDSYGNTYTYAGLKTVADRYPVPKDQTVSSRQVRRELGLGGKDPKPTVAASAGSQPAKARAAAAPAPTQAPAATRASVSDKVRVFAHPRRPNAYRHGGAEQLLNSTSGVTTFKSYFTGIYGLDRRDVVLKPLRPGATVIAGTILGRLGRVTPGTDPHVSFAIRPAGRGAPRIDPKPILDGWKLLESTAIYRAAGQNALLGAGGNGLGVGQIFLMSKEALTRQVLSDPRIEIYACGRRDIKAGAVDRRVLATLAYLSQSGLRPTVTTLKCGHSLLTTSGNISEHSTGDAVDIGAINGIRIEPKTQGEGSITDITIRRLLTLQGSMKPHQIISLMSYPNADNTLALPDHYDHIHVGFHPVGANTPGLKQSATLKPGQWARLLDRLGKIDNPTVATKPSRSSIPARPGD